MRAHALLIPALALLIAGCGSGDDVATNNAAADLTPEGPSLTAQLFGGGKPMPLSLQSAHPAGMVLQLTSIQAKPTETVIGVIAINGSEREQWLNRFSNNRRAFIVASNGERFYLSPPPTNTDLAVQPNQRMEGELVFIGRLPKEGSATLVLNDGQNMSNRFDTSPGFRIDLPLEQAAFSDDGSKKKSVA